MCLGRRSISIIPSLKAEGGDQPAALPAPLMTSPLGKIKNSGGLPRKLDLQYIFSSMSALNPDGIEDLGKNWWTDHRSWH